jgi:hypothetical protein
LAAAEKLTATGKELAPVEGQTQEANQGLEQRGNEQQEMAKLKGKKGGENCEKS